MAVGAAADSPDAEHLVAARDTLDAGHNTLGYDHPDSRSPSAGVDGRSHHRSDRLVDERP